MPSEQQLPIEDICHRSALMRVARATASNALYPIALLKDQAEGMLSAGYVEEVSDGNCRMTWRGWRHWSMLNIETGTYRTASQPMKDYMRRALLSANLDLPDVV